MSQAEIEHWALVEGCNHAVLTLDAPLTQGPVCERCWNELGPIHPRLSHPLVLTEEEAALAAAESQRAQ